MTVRMYFTKVAPGYTGTTNKGTWSTAGAGQFKLGLIPDDASAAVAATTQITTTVGTAALNRTMQWSRFVSDPAIAGGTIPNTAVVSGVLGLLKNNAGLTAALRLHVWVTTGDTNVARGTLLTNTSIATTFPSPTTGLGTAFTSPTFTSVAIQAGDRIVVEIGYTNTGGTTTTYSASMWHGVPKMVDMDNGAAYQIVSASAQADLAASGGVTTLPGWVDFTGIDNLFNTKFENISDNFDDNTIGALWANSYGTYKEEDGMLQVAAQNAVYSGAYTNRVYTIRESQVFINIKALVAGTIQTTGPQAWISFTLVTGVTGTSAEHFFDGENNTVVFRDNTVYDDAGSVTLNDAVANFANVAWLRMREASNVFYWETSPTGYDQWTIRKQLATHGWMRYGTQGIIIQGYRNGADATDYGKWDNFNLAPAAGPTNAVRSGAFLHAA